MWGIFFTITKSDEPIECCLFIVVVLVLYMNAGIAGIAGIGSYYIFLDAAVSLWFFRTLSNQPSGFCACADFSTSVSFVV